MKEAGKKVLDIENKNIRLGKGRKMFEVLILIMIIGVSSYLKVKKAGIIEDKAKSSKSNPPVYQRPVSQPASQPVRKNFAVMPEHKKVPPNVERNCAAEDKHRSENNVYAKKTVKPVAVPNVSRPYTEPQKQTRKEKKDNRIAAIRLYEGDHVPQGYRMVKCHYCAAENLIAHSARGNYMCYFCHEDL